MVGKEDMGLFGWKQLILWSLEHACMDQDEYLVTYREWEKLWQHFLAGVEKTYGAELDAHSEGSAP